MSADIDELLREAGGPEAQPLDTDALWSRGRRQRRMRLAGGSLAGMAALAVVSVVAVNLTGSNVPVIAPVTSQDDSAPPERSGDDPTTTPDDGASSGVADDGSSSTDPGETSPGTAIDSEPAEAGLRDLEASIAQAIERVKEMQAEAEREEAAAREAEQRAADAQQSGAQPDAIRMQDPCEVHEGGEMRVFIDVVSPVATQAVGSSIELVGCSSVYEGTIRYRLLDANAAVVVDSFTTATYGGPEIGEFRETIAVPGLGEYELQVFWDDPSDGSERDLVSIAVTN